MARAWPFELGLRFNCSVLGTHSEPPAGIILYLAEFLCLGRRIEHGEKKAGVWVRTSMLFRHY